MASQDLDISSSKPPSALSFLTDNVVASRLSDYYSSFQNKRAALGLPNPGNIDNIAKEVERDVFLTNLTFGGLRAEITKMFSATPLFQVSHALSIGVGGGQGGQPPYIFSALYGSPAIFCQASLYNDLRLQGRFNYRWTSRLITKAQAELPPSASESAMLQMEADYQANDFTANIKAINPSVLEGGVTGIFTGDYLQSVTPRLALGISALWQRAAMNTGPETLVSYAGRYRSAGGDWIASARILGAGTIQCSYWKRIAERLEGGVDVSLQFQPGGPPGLMGGGGMQQTGLATLGAKYDFRASTVRVQGDSQGKLGVLLEKKVAPAVQITFAGEIDHTKNAAKLGLAVQIENQPEELLEQAEKAGPAAMENQIPPPF